MKFKQTRLKDLIHIQPTVFSDERGFFMETYHQKKFQEAGIDELFVQENHSRSEKGILRGLHYQLNPNAQGKLVRVVAGTVYDVAVDLRKDSESYLKWEGFELSETNKDILYIPAGFAHGFLVLSEAADFVYKCTALYSPADERGIIWDDPDLAINWPSGEKHLSEKDIKNPTLSHAEFNF